MTYKDAIREMKVNAAAFKKAGGKLDDFIKDLKDPGMITAAKIGFLETE